MKDCLIPAFDTLTPEQTQKINANSYTVTYKKGEVLFRDNHPIGHLMFLKSGLIKYFKEISHGRVSLFKIGGKGEFIGLMSASYGKTYRSSASAIEHSEVILTDLEIFREVIRENGNYALQIMQLMSADGFMMMERMINISMQQIPGRMAGILLFFANKIYNNNTFTLPLNRQELADLVSTTKETVSRTLTEFKNDRLIEIDDRNVKLTSVDLLNMLSRMG